jgi:hypothetical protein
MQCLVQGDNHPRSVIRPSSRQSRLEFSAMPTAFFNSKVPVHRHVEPRIRPQIVEWRYASRLATASVCQLRFVTSFIHLINLTYLDDFELGEARNLAEPPAKLRRITGFAVLGMLPGTPQKSAPRNSYNTELSKTVAHLNSALTSNRIYA